MLAPSLRRLVAAAAATALLTFVPDASLPYAGEGAERATATLAGSVRKPVKPTARPRPVVPRTLLPNDPLWRDSWSLAKVGAPAAWTVTTGEERTIVAVLDTGIDQAHPDLQGSFVPGWDAVNEDADAGDDHGHGTAVAGVIAARSNNGVGVTGACWRCSLMSVKVIGANGVGSAADIAEGIRWAADNGARVINISFVMSGPDDGIAAAIGYATSRGVLVVAAAGNAGTSEPTFPAGLPGVLSVTGTDSSDARYGWAAYGGWVKLAAPGCSQSTTLGGSYGEFCGTSSAAAFASGIAALTLSASPDAPAEAVVAALSAQAVRVGEFVSSGRIDAEAAVGSLVKGAAPAPAAPRPDSARTKLPVGAI